QVYDAVGAPSGGEFQVNTYTNSYQYTQQVAALDDGGFVVTWASYLQDGSGYGVYARRYAPGGGLLEVTIDTTAPDQPTIGLDAASDSGASDSDGITNDTTPTLIGAADAGATVEILRDGTVVD